MRKQIILVCAVLLTACSSPEHSHFPVSIPVPAISSSATQAPVAMPGTSPAQYTIPSMDGMLAAHNRARAEVGTPPLQWSEELSQYSKEWAEHLAHKQGCQMVHRQEAGQDHKQYGENLFWGSPADSSFGVSGIQSVTAAQVANEWAKEKAYYNHKSNSCRPGQQCGHYTQMVWRSTKQVGCGMSVCPNLGQIWVCSYNPTGNWIGQRPY